MANWSPGEAWKFRTGVAKCGVMRGNGFVSGAATVHWPQVRALRAFSRYFQASQIRLQVLQNNISLNT